MVRVAVEADPSAPVAVTVSSQTTVCSSTADEKRSPAAPTTVPPDVPRQPRGGVLPNPLVDDLKETHARRGVLIPLKTTQEVRQDHLITRAYITRAPAKAANEVITYVCRPSPPWTRVH